MSYDQLVTFIRTADLDRSTSFYRRLGLELVLDQGRCRIFRVASNGFLGICLGEPGTDGVVITLVASDVEARCADIEAQDIAFETPVAYNPTFDITHAYLRDPDGHLVEIQRFESEAWQMP